MYYLLQLDGGISAWNHRVRRWSVKISVRALQAMTLPEHIRRVHQTHQDLIVNPAFTLSVCVRYLDFSNAMGCIVLCSIHVDQAPLCQSSIIRLHSRTGFVAVTGSLQPLERHSSNKDGYLRLMIYTRACACLSSSKVHLYR